MAQSVKRLSFQGRESSLAQLSACLLDHLLESIEFARLAIFLELGRELLPKPPLLHEEQHAMEEQQATVVEGFNPPNELRTEFLRLQHGRIHGSNMTCNRPQSERFVAAIGSLGG